MGATNEEENVLRRFLKSNGDSEHKPKKSPQKTGLSRETEKGPMSVRVSTCPEGGERKNIQWSEAQRAGPKGQETIKGKVK